MKQFWMMLTALLIASPLVFADEKVAEEKPAAKKADAKEDVEAKAKQAQQTLEALGRVLEIFGGGIAARTVWGDENNFVPAEVGVVLLDEREAPGEAGGDPLEQQFLQQFRQLSTTELNFVRAVCKPDKEQDKKIKAASNAALKTTTKKFAEVQKKLQQGIRAGQEPEWPDPRKLMSEVLLKTVKESMSEDAAKRYEAELEKRAAARKRAALLNLVAKLDKDLVLTADQRGKLSEALDKNWKDSWCQQLETFMYGDTYMPVIPDAQVLPALTEKQKQIWNGLPKHHNQIWGWAGFGFGQAVEIAEEGFIVEQAVEANEEAKAAEEKEEDPKKADEKKDEKP